MVDFAQSFNATVVQFAQTLKELRESDETLRLLAISDPLTGLNNRRRFL
jgi:PleD family two-component response regulator